MKTVNTAAQQKERSKLHDEFMSKVTQPQHPQHTQGELMSESLKIILDYAYEQMDTPNKDGYVIAPDSVLREHHRRASDPRIVKATNMHNELINVLKKSERELERLKTEMRKPSGERNSFWIATFFQSLLGGATILAEIKDTLERAEQK